MDKEEARATFRIEKNEWKKFKRITKNLGSNASVELRRFIKTFNDQKSTWDKKEEK